VNFLSNIFPLKKIDSSGTTTGGQTTINFPTLALRVRRLMIDGEEVPEVNFGDLAAIEDEEVLRWYQDDGKIQLTVAQAAGLAIKIWYDKAFVVPAAAVATDVPDEMMELVYVGGSYRYFRKMVSVVAVSRQTYPDVTPDEMSEARDAWKKEYNELLTEYKKNR